jgi:hypothetical protein
MPDPMMNPMVVEALQNERVRALYDVVNASTPITVVSNSDGCWGSTTVGSCTEITVTATRTPAAALAHELLHAKLKIAGYHQHVTFCSMDNRQDLLIPITSALDNELQHHKMFWDFVAMGLSPTEFYHDDDNETFAWVRNELGKVQVGNHPGEFFLLLATVIAPGGVGGDAERRELRGLLRAKCSTATWQALLDVEQEFDLWKRSTALLPGNTIANVLRHLGFNRTWVGVSVDDFPNRGFFSGTPFTVAELQDWHKQNAQMEK